MQPLYNNVYIHMYSHSKGGARQGGVVEGRAKIAVKDFFPFFLPHSRLSAQSHLSLGRPSHATISPSGHGATTCTSPHSPSPHSHSHAPPAHFCALASVILSHARRGQVWRSARIVCQFTCRVRPGCTHHPSMISNASFRQSSGVGGGCGSSYFF